MLRLFSLGTERYITMLGLFCAISYKKERSKEKGLEKSKVFKSIKVKEKTVEVSNSTQASSQ